MADATLSSPADLKGLTTAQKFARVAAFAGVPVSAVQGIYRVESSSGQDPRAFQPNPASSALGPLQITTPALQDVQDRTGQVLDRTKLDDSLFAAGHILYHNMQAFNGDVQLAVAGYNQGIGKANSPAGLAYASKALGPGEEVVSASNEPLEVQNTDQSPNRAMVNILYAPELQGKLGDIAPRDLAQYAKGLKPAPVSKTAQAAGVIAGSSAAFDGATPDQVLAAQQGAQQLPNDTQAQGINALGGAAPAASTTALDALSQGEYEASVDQQQLIDNTSAGQAFVDSAMQNNVVARLALRGWDDYVASRTRDPNWSYTPEQDLEDRKQGYTEVEMDSLRNASSDVDYQYRKDEIQRDRDSQFNLAQHGLAGFAGGMVGGALDPVQWVAGAGVGAAVGGVLRGTTLAARLAAAGVTGSVSNLAATAALQAAGANVSSHDYVMAGLTGAALGAVGGVFHAGVAGSLEALRNGMAQQKVDLHLRAAADLGPGATPDQIAERAAQLEQQDFEAREAMRNSINFAPVPDDQRILPGNIYSGDPNLSPDTFLINRQSPLASTNPNEVFATGRVEEGQPLWRATFRAQPDGNGGFMVTRDDGGGNLSVLAADGSFKEAVNGMPAGSTPMPFANEAAAQAGIADSIANLGGTPGRTIMDDMIQAYPNLRQVNDEAVQRVMAETLARSLQNQQLRPVTPERLKVLGNVIQNLPQAMREQLETYGMALAKSNNPVAQWVSGNLMESAAGTSARVRTASIIKTQLENISREQWGEYNSIRELYRHETGGSAINEALRAESSAKFDALVAAEVNRRRWNPPSTDAAAGVHERVAQAADALERAYQQQLNWQKAAKTLGWQHLPDSARGYMPQRVNVQRIMSLSPEERNAFAQTIAQQLVANNHDIDAALAQTLANEYVQHGVQRAAGAVERPTNLISDDLSDQVEEAITRLGVNGNAAAQRLVDKYQRGGASYTRKRYEFDMDAPVRQANGVERRLGDYFVTDQNSLFQRYMARNSGEVALAQYGVYGQSGIAALRNAMVQAYDQAGVKNYAHELQAFDNFMADMMGQPVNGQGATKGAVVAQTFRQLASMNLLGGMGFTQAAEMANLAVHLGADQILRSVPIIRQLFRDVRLNNTNNIFDQIELIGGKNQAAELWYFPFETSQDDLRMYGYETPGLFRRAMANSSRWFNVVNGHRAVHGWQMRVATEQIASKVLRAANGNAKLTKLAAEMGFDPAFMARLKADLPNIAEFEGKWVKNLDLGKTQDPQMVAQLIQGVQRGAKQIIQGSFRGEQFKAQTTWLGQLLTQFRSFSFLAMEKQWARVAGTVGIPAATAYMLGQMMAALPIHLARVHLNAMGMDDQKRKQYIADSTTPAALTLATMNYAGLTGLLGDSVNTAFSAYASLSGKDLRRDQVLGRGGQTGEWSVGSFVPAVAYGDSVLRNAQGVIQKPSFQNAAKFGRSVLPGGNIPFFAFAMNHLSQ